MVGPAAAARTADRLLDAGIAAFAAWTVVYDVCLLTGIGAGWALGAWAVALAGGALAWRRLATGRVAAPAAAADRDAPRDRRGDRTDRLLLGAAVVLAVATAAAFALTSVQYRIVWVLWVGAAACALARAVRRERRDGDGPAPAAPGWPEVAVVLGWVVALAALSLAVHDSDGDDAFYVHQTAWIGAHGIFPLHDVVFSNDRLPALYFPPVSSYEALAGALSWLTGVLPAGIVYFAVPPLASGLAVLALWRLLRAWAVPLAALALTTAILFLVFGADHRTAFGAYFVSRIWQGKTLLLTIGLPVLLALLHEYAREPDRRRAIGLGLAGVAAVGVSSSAMFVVPVLAVGALLPMLRRERGRAVIGMVAACAYPVAGAVVTRLSGGRTPDVYTAAQVVSSDLAHRTFGTGALALLGLAAVLIVPAVVPRAAAGAMIAGAVLLLGALLAPDVPRALFYFSGLGRVLWRLTWILPVAAAVGALAVLAGGRRPPLALRATPAILLCAALVAFGVPLWDRSLGASVGLRPQLKLDAQPAADARAILARARSGDVILARLGLSQALLALSGTITTVSPRDFYTRALAHEPSLHAAARLRLERTVRFGLPHRRRALAALRRDLRIVGVDVACVRARDARLREALGRAGLAPWAGTASTACLRRR